MPRPAAYTPEEGRKLLAAWEASEKKIWPFVMAQAEADGKSKTAVYNAIIAAHGPGYERQKRPAPKSKDEGIFSARSNEVWALHRTGLSASEIALRTGFTRAEVSGLVMRRRVRMDRENKRRADVTFRASFEEREERQPYRPGIDPKPAWLQRRAA